MKLSKILLTASLVGCLFGMSSCRKGLCYNHFRKAAITLTWEQEWERDYGMNHSGTWDANHHGFDYHTLRPELPEGVTLISYKDNANPRETFMGIEGGDVNVEETSGHSFLFYNNDTEYIVLSDMASLTDARASTTTRSRSSLLYMNSVYPMVRSTNPPDILYASYIDQVPDIQMHEERQLPVKMQPLVFTYLVRYEFEYGLERVALARGALGGMAESVYLRNGVTSENASIILYDCEVTSYGCRADVHSFGVPSFPDEYYGQSKSRGEQTYTLNLEVRLTSGSIMEFNYDITDQIEKQPRGGVITIKGIRIEDEQGQPAPGSGAFDVEVEGWGPHEDIILPVEVQK